MAAGAEAVAASEAVHHGASGVRDGRAESRDAQRGLNCVKTDKCPDARHAAPTKCTGWLAKRRDRCHRTGASVPFTPPPAPGRPQGVTRGFGWHPAPLSRRRSVLITLERPWARRAARRAPRGSARGFLARLQRRVRRTHDERARLPAASRGLERDPRRGRRTARLEDVRAIHCRRPKRPHIADTIPKPYWTWAQNQAHTALLDVLAALPVVPWISNPHADRPAAHKPQQLVAATRCGRSCGAAQPDHSDPAAARGFTKAIDGPLNGKLVLGGHMSVGEGRALMVATRHVDPSASPDRTSRSR